jgi:hypothetical protein
MWVWSFGELKTGYMAGWYNFLDTKWNNFPPEILDPGPMFLLLQYLLQLMNHE